MWGGAETGANTSAEIPWAFFQAIKASEAEIGLYFAMLRAVSRVHSPGAPDGALEGVLSKAANAGADSGCEVKW
jgi:hypothetical protein